MKIQPPEAITPFIRYHPSGDERYAVLDKTIEQYDAHPDSLIQVLHMAQQLFGYLSAHVLQYVARSLKIPIAQAYGVATFYHLFTMIPCGKHQVTVCRGTACHVRGAPVILDKLEKELGIKEGETTKDNMFSLHSARCIGACAMAPAISVGDDVYGRLSADKVHHLCQHEFKSYT